MKKAHPARVPEYLQHIVEAIDRATGYVAGMDAAAFEKDTRTQDAVIRSLEIIGEAANKARAADQNLQSSAPEIPWDVMYGMRNRIVHDYKPEGREFESLQARQLFKVYSVHTGDSSNRPE